MAQQQMTISQAVEEARKQHKEGRAADAASICQQILSYQPQNPDALHLLGLIASQTGQSKQAIELLSRAAALKPDSADLFCTLGNAQLAVAKPNEAADAYRKSLLLRPHCSDAFNGLGYALYAQRRYDESVAALRMAIEIEPEFAEAHNNLGIALSAARQFEPAIREFRKALELRPDYAEAHLNLGSALSQVRRLEEAIEAFQKVIELRPDLAEAHNNLAGALEQHGRYADAIASYRKAIELGSRNPQVHFNLGVSLLRQGEWEEGWKEYESRLSDDSPSSSFFRSLKQPRWDGEELKGRRILIQTEQGLGDAIQFCRYIPLISQRGGKVVLRCQAELAPLLRNLSGVETILTQDDPLPEFDLYCPMMSLPFVFKTTRKTIPADVPYLHVDPSRARDWRKRLQREEVPMRIGLAWAGNASYRDDFDRSLKLSWLQPLAGIPNTIFYSLQKGPAADQLKSPPDGMTIKDWTHELHDLSDTAALIDNLDLIITVDTAVAHLAGALNKPVWVLLPSVPDWRWLRQREDSPWYPMMRLFRQPRKGDWDTPIEQIAKELASVSASEST